MSAPRVNYADPRKGTNTSDHTYQSARILLVDSEEKTLASVKGSTWNLMNYGISLKTNGIHMNNPWDFDEDHPAYITRKTRQLDKIIEIIQSGEASDKNDFMLLQEVDIFFPASAKLKATPEQQAERKRLVDNFVANLHRQGWEVLLQNGNAKQQPLVMLYNTKTLRPAGEPCGAFPTTTGQCRGLEQEFTHLPTQRNITLVNLHLDYEADYSNTIPDYQRQKAAQGKFTIMGGDTNHAPNQNIVGLINTWSNITNIAGDLAGITHLHKNSQNIQKCYDGFFANPTNNTSVRIIEQAAEVFKKNDAGEYIVEALPMNPHVHCSAPGEAWRRGGYIEFMQQKENEEKSSPDSAPSTVDKVNAFFSSALTQSDVSRGEEKLENTAAPGKNGGVSPR